MQNSIRKISKALEDYRYRRDVRYLVRTLDLRTLRDIGLDHLRDRY